MRASNLVCASLMTIVASTMNILAFRNCQAFMPAKNRTDCTDAETELRSWMRSLSMSMRSRWQSYVD